MTWKTLLFSAEGRINRAKYWLGGLTAGAVFMVLYGILMVPVFMTRNPDNSVSPIGIAAFVAMGLLYIPLLWVSIVLGIKRFHDRDKSGWWMLIALVPYIGGIWIFVECGCLPGTRGHNRFGSDPLAPGADVVEVFGEPERAIVR